MLVLMLYDAGHSSGVLIDPNPKKQVCRVKERTIRLAFRPGAVDKVSQ